MVDAWPQPAQSPTCPEATPLGHNQVVTSLLRIGFGRKTLLWFLLGAVLGPFLCYSLAIVFSFWLYPKDLTFILPLPIGLGYAMGFCCRHSFGRGILLVSTALIYYWLLPELPYLGGRAAYGGGCGTCSQGARTSLALCLWSIAVPLGQLRYQLSRKTSTLRAHLSTSCDSPDRR